MIAYLITVVILSMNTGYLQASGSSIQELATLSANDSDTRDQQRKELAACFFPHMHPTSKPVKQSFEHKKLQKLQEEIEQKRADKEKRAKQEEKKYYNLEELADFLDKQQEEDHELEAWAEEWDNHNSCINWRYHDYEYPHIDACYDQGHGQDSTFYMWESSLSPEEFKWTLVLQRNQTFAEQTEIQKAIPHIDEIFQTWLIEEDNQAKALHTLVKARSKNSSISNRTIKKLLQRVTALSLVVETKKQKRSNQKVDNEPLTEYEDYEMDDQHTNNDISLLNGNTNVSVEETDDYRFWPHHQQTQDPIALEEYMLQRSHKPKKRGK